MIIEKLHVWSHGKLKDLELEFSPFLNVIYGENEAGKSTLQNFIMTMLYGPLRRDIKQKRYEDDVLLKKPWNGERWGGTIRFRLDNGEIYEVVRDFGKRTVNVYDEFGNDITTKFSRTRNGDSNFAEELLGVDKAIFKDTVFISQNMVDSISNRESLRDRIQAIVSTGSEDISSKFAVEKLENTLNKIGTPYALSKPLGSYINKLNELEDELEKSKKAFREILEKLEELQNLRSELTELTEKEKNLEYAGLIVSRNDLEEKIKEVEETQKKIDMLTHILREKEIVEINEEDFQAAVALNAKRAELSEHLRKLKEDLGEYQEQMRKLESNLPAYADKVSEFIEKLEEMYKELQIEKSSLESIEDQIKALSKDKKELSKTLSEVSRFETVSEEEVNELLESETRKKYYEEWKRAKQEKIESTKLQIELLERSRYSKRRNSLALLVLGTLIGISPVFGAPTITVLIGGLLIIAALLYLTGAPKAEEINNMRKEVSKLREELEPMSFQDKSKELLHRFNVASKDEFLEKYRKFKSVSGKLDLINQDVERLQKRQDETISKIRLHIETVKDIFSKIGLEFDDSEDESKMEERIEKITSSIDIAIKDLKSVLEAKKSLESIRGQITKLEDEAERVKNNLRKTEDELSRILRKYSVESFEGLKKAYDEYTKASDEISELNKLKAKRSALLGDKSLEDYKNELEELKQEIERVKGDHTYIRLSKEEIKANLKEVRGRIVQLREQIKMNEGRVEILEKSYKPIQEIEEAIAEVKEKVNELKMCREALEIAKETLIEAERDFTKDFVRVLNEKISPVVKMVTGKYSDIRVDDDLDVNVRDPEHKIFAKCDYLSRGAIDQIYFILKVVIAEMLTRNYESLPLIIDDIFANYDPQRLENGLKLLVELSSRSQIIFFTCHKNQFDKLKEIATVKKCQIINEDIGGFKIMKVICGEF
ncbi:AAA family ATPase [Archaeoglobus sp.]|uniref:AAA family ATPase n=1 Tax=Archaeoglobus sp. TaxID=1872626 RepID=UPI0024AB9109|nr:AAA family ATPase [Archaeoglobus sp.]MDI3497317.1 hypothetical protein [Archaeoglobus sp.]